MSLRVAPSDQAGRRAFYWAQVGRDAKANATILAALATLAVATPCVHADAREPPSTPAQPAHTGEAAQHQPDDASSPAELDRQARRAFAEQRYARAAQLFDRAFGMAPHSKSAMNAGVAFDRAGDLARAADSYQSALSAPEELDPAERAAAEARLEILKTRLISVVVPQPVGGTVEAYGRALTIPARFHLRPGKHSIAITSGAERRMHPVDGAAGQRIVVRPSEPRAAQLAPPPSRPTRAQSPPGADSRASTGSAWPWVALGGSAVLTGAGVGFGLMTRSTVDDFEAGGRRDADLRDQAVTQRAVAFTAFGLAAISATIGVVLLLEQGGSEPHTARAEREPRLRF